MKHILFTLSLLALGFALLAGGSRQAHAFCGFFVSGADAELVNETTEAVLMRDGLETVLSMRNNYKGPPEDFAMVVPVPQVLKKEDVNTLDGAVFDRLSNYTKPRLVEYWERPGCAPKSGIRGPTQTAGGGVSGSIPRPGGPPGAKIEAQFEVGEYEILILSASESNGLEQWLLDNNYNIPKGASEVLASYIARGMYFFVAKVNASKVMFDSKGNALLSPLRFHYTSAEFSLPVRLGLLNAKGPQDLLIHTISRDGRHEVANRENVTIPTNLVVPEKTKDNFSRKYEEIFRRTLRKNPNAVVTEFAWDYWFKCDPCTQDNATQQDIRTLGGDVLDTIVYTEPMGSLQVVDTIASPGLEPSTFHELHGAITDHEEALTSCYTDVLLPRNETRKFRALVQLDVMPNGNIEGATVNWSGPQKQRISSCLSATLGDLSLVYALPPDKRVVELHIEFFHASKEVRRWHRMRWAWTVTRMHARYTSESLGEDLIFRQAPPLAGGIGRPKGKKATLNTKPFENEKHNRFQARYIILHRFEGRAPACQKDEKRKFTWGAPPRSARKR